MSLTFTVIVALTLLSAGPTGAQPQPSEHELLEEQHIRMRAQIGDSHASGMRPELGPVILGNPTRAVVALRVGLYYSFTATGGFSEFASLHHPFAEITNTAGTVHVIDRTTGKLITAVEPGTVVRVEFDGSGYQVGENGAYLGTFGGPIFLRATEAANLFRVESIRRTFGGTQVPLYRGSIEIARGSSTQPNRVNVVNVVELESYVPGVVANESIASYHMEALKAQAVAARGYAVANVGRYVSLGYPFDIVDSSASQVYRGVISEHPRAVQAAAETIGLGASHNGRIISALYSSSFGGHSEHNEWIFNIPSSSLPETNVTPYLRAIYDGDGAPPDFSSEPGVTAFWSFVQPNNFDDCVRVGNRFSRWRIVLPGATIKARLVPGRYVLTSGNVSGEVTDVVLVTRMAGSARAAIARITLTTGAVEVRGWDNLRNVLGRSAVTTPAMCAANPIAANFTLNNPSVIEISKNADGTVRELVAWGGGWGHNVGLSQYGAHGRARGGQAFLEILNAYYTGVDIGSYPIDIGRDPGTLPATLRQQFYTTGGRGILVVRASGLKGLGVHVNGLHDIMLDQNALAGGPVHVDISPYLVPGVNTIQYSPVGRDGRATVTVVID